MSAEQPKTPSREPTLNFQRLDDEARKLLLCNLNSFPLSVRARNVLTNAGLRVLGEAIQVSEAEWFRIQNCGRKTVNEMRNLASQTGLALGTVIENWPADRLDELVADSVIDGTGVEISQNTTLANEIDFETADEGTKAWLVEELRELDLSTRAQNIFVMLGLITVADLVQRTESELLRMNNCGSKTVNEIKLFLASRGLRLETDIRNFDPQAASRVRAALRNTHESARQKQNQESFGRALNATKSLEEELLLILAIEAPDRDVQLVTKLWGWFGKRPRTLESVGQEYGLTRERVRQIADRVAKQIRRRKLVTPFLFKAAQLIRKSCPATAPALVAKLQGANISVVGIHPFGIAKACELLDIPIGLQVSGFAGTTVFMIEDMEDSLKAFQREARRRTQANGCVNFGALCEELRISETGAQGIHALLSASAEFEWLNAGQTWFYSRKPVRNRLFNLASKVLATCPRLRPNELRRAVARSRRLEVKPPVEVLERLVQATGLATIEDGFLVANPDVVRPPEPGSIEEIFVQVLRDNGPALTGREFEELCIAAGINPISFYIYRAGSPLVSQLAPGVFSLVDATPPPGLVEELSTKARSFRRLVEHGWDKQGRLWCALSLSRAVITTGAVALPSFVANLVQGEWKILLPDGTEVGGADCKNTFLKGLRKPLFYLGAEPGDLVLFEFELRTRGMKMRIGGQELIELAESGDIDQLLEEEEFHAD
jgi:DNA-directed RNA polymerase subunit alpha